MQQTVGPAIQTSMGSRAVQRPGAMQGKAIEQNSKERKLSDAAAAPDLFPTAYITRGSPTCNCRISSTMSECYITENGYTEVVTWDNRYLWCNAWTVFFSKNFDFFFFCLSVTFLDLPALWKSQTGFTSCGDLRKSPVTVSDSPMNNWRLLSVPTHPGTLQEGNKCEGQNASIKAKMCDFLREGRGETTGAFNSRRRCCCGRFKKHKWF